MVLTVWSLCWGDKYSDYHVQRLQREVAKHLSVEHEFKCITDRDIEGVECIRPIVDWPGWWGKISLFFPGFASERNLWFDLDVVITGSLDDLVPYTECELAAPANWAQSGHGGIQSSVMAWNGELTLPFDEFDPAWAHWPPINKPGVLWGDQEHYTKLRDEGRIDWTPLPPDWILSYKYHCQAELPENARVVCFHGQPKPESVRVPWIDW